MKTRIYAAVKGLNNNKMTCGAQQTRDIGLRRRPNIEPTRFNVLWFRGVDLIK